MIKISNKFELCLIPAIIGDNHRITKKDGSLFHHGIHPQISQFKNCIISLDDSPFVFQFERPVNFFYCSTSSYEQDKVYVTGYDANSNEIVGDDSIEMVAPMFDNVLLWPVDPNTGKSLFISYVEVSTKMGNTAILDNLILGII